MGHGRGEEEEEEEEECRTLTLLLTRWHGGKKRGEGGRKGVEKEEEEFG